MILGGHDDRGTRKATGTKSEISLKDVPVYLRTPCPKKHFKLKRQYSIDRVFKNKAVDKTHLAEFHQVEGLICDRGLTLGDLQGVLEDFFSRLGMSKLRFKAAYNPYTEPSMEIFGYHEGLKKWIEVGNSGMLRPEVLLPMGFPEDVGVIAWGLSLERGIILLILGGFAWCYTHTYIEDGVTFIAKSSVTFLAKSHSPLLLQLIPAANELANGINISMLYKMKGYVDQLEHLGYVLPQDLIVGLILNGLTKDFARFVRNYNMHNMGKTIGELHAMLIEYEKGLPKKAETPQVIESQSDKIQSQ
ncbi:phenylalanine--tRNA ligase alpha subunit, cytoplasmic [Tanacetum coccineum]